VGADTAADLITPENLRAHVAYLASDRLGGRGPGTEGDALARDYLAGQLEAMGFAPGAPGGTWEQPFSLVGVTAKMPSHWVFKSPEGKEIAFQWWDEYIAASGVQSPKVNVDEAEVVFVGYGIQAIEESWDDFKGADLEGKILLMLNNDPDWDPGLFQGKRRLYYGRWTYKYESAARQGAAGAIIIHTRPSAGYPWQVVQRSWAGEQFELPAKDDVAIKIKGWLTEEAARRLVAFGGQSLDALIEAARSRKFKPVPLMLKTSIGFQNEITGEETANVAGLLRGSDPKLRDEVVIFSAHHDHLGVGEPDGTGDRIYNGAVDNGVAMAQALGVAQALSALPQPPRRSVLILFVGAEEQGLLGSRYFTQHPTFPPGKMAADINFELGNIWGRTHDVEIFGKGKSTMEETLFALAAKQNRVVKGETALDEGWYYRSDQFSFARIGVPAIWFKSGTDFIGRPEGWGAAVMKAWIDEHYHQPDDELEESWNFDGLVEDARLAFYLGVAVANGNEMPLWFPGDEFEEIRKRALEEAELSQNHLWYTGPAQKWTEALPLGNGRLGAMVFGTVPKERFQLNEESLWAGEPADPYPPGAVKTWRTIQELVLDGRIEEAHALGMEKLTLSPTSFRSYQPLGDLWIALDHPPVLEDYQRSLDLETGVARIRFHANNVTYTREAFLSAKDDVLVVRFSADQPGKISAKVTLTREKDARTLARGARLHLDGQIVDVEAPDAYDDNPGGSGPGGAHMRFSGRLLARTQGGTVKGVQDHLLVDGANEVVLLFTGATDYNLEKMKFDRSIDPAQKADALLKRAAEKSWEALELLARGPLQPLRNGGRAHRVARGPGRTGTHRRKEAL
jgi:Zn-dependent M28 family amino/carboxypeptidase